MELRQYLSVIVSRWWIILPSIFIGLTGALVFSYSRTPIYESSASYVAVLNNDFATDQSNSFYSVDILTGRQRIFVTYCQIFMSGAAREEAFKIMGLDFADEELAKYKIACSNPPETGVLLVTVQGKAPALVKKLNEAIGVAATANADAVYSFYAVKPLDPVTMEDKPVSPKYPQMAVFGGAFGLILGVTSAFMIDYLRRPSEKIEALSIRNPMYGVYNERYFQQRFQTELERASIHNRPISMILLRIQPNEDWGLIPENSQNILIRSVALKLEDRLGKGHIIAYLRSMTFGILLIESTSEQTQRQIEELQEFIRTYPAQTEDGFQMAFSSEAGIVISSGNLMDYPKLESAAIEALKVAEADPKKALYVVHAAPRPFLTEEELEMLQMSEESSSNSFANSSLVRSSDEWLQNGGNTVNSGNGGRSPKGVKPDLLEERMPDSRRGHTSLLSRVTDELKGEEPK